MRRWFAVLLLTLLPLQFSWAAVAAYCGHEPGEHAHHLGHDEHPPADQSSAGNSNSIGNDSAPADETDPAGVDCGHCHGSCTGMPAAAGDMALLIPASHPVTPNKGALRTLAQSPPERPQWLLLA